MRVDTNQLRSSSRHHMQAKRHATAKAAQLEGWLISFLLHGAIVLFGLLLVKRTPLPSHSEPFRWNISIVSSLPADSPPAALPEKAIPTESLTEPPPIATSAPPTAPRRSADQPTQATHLIEASRLQANSVLAPAEQVYQVVGPDGSISFTNVPSDSRYHEKRLDQTRLSTVDSSTAFNTNTALNTNMSGVSPPASPSGTATAPVGQTYLVPIGDFPDTKTQALIRHYEQTLKLRVLTLPALPVTDDMVDPVTNHLIGEVIAQKMKERWPGLATDPNVRFLAATDRYCQ